MGYCANQQQTPLIELMQRLADWSIGVDGDDRVTMVSDSAKYFGCDPDLVLGNEWTILLPETDQVRFRQLLNTARQDCSGFCGPSSLDLQIGNSERRYYEVTVCRLPVDGQPHDVCLFRDVTDQRGYYEGTAEANRNNLIAELAGGVVHNFNNVLAGIMLNAGLLADIEEDQRQQLLDRVLISTERGADLCRNVLSFLQRSPSRPGALPVEPLLKELIGLFETAARRNGVSVSWSAQPDLWLHADPLLVRQIVLNLLFSARNAAKDGRWIEIHAVRDQHTVSITIQSSGPDIGQEPNISTRVGNLSICRNLAEGMGGRVDAVTPAGAGTLFVLALPAAVPADQA